MSKSVSPGDIEKKLREIQSEVDTAAAPAKPAATAIGAVAAAGAVGLAFAIGQRKARKKTTIVEIKRV